MEHGGHILYKANVKEILVHHQTQKQAASAEMPPPSTTKAVGVKLADGREFRSKTVISNASRWDTFENMIPDNQLPEGEKLFR
jgi:prolycopene isomerase